MQLRLSNEEDHPKLFAILRNALPFTPSSLEELEAFFAPRHRAAKKTHEETLDCFEQLIRRASALLK